MRGYEFTERGKIIIAILIVILMLVIPSLILAIVAWNNSPPPVEPSRSTATDPDERPVISDRPLPDGSGFNPPEPTETGNGEHGSFDPPIEYPDDDPYEEAEIGPMNIDRTAGTMSFRFNPDLQDTLDADTVAMLGEFITSPRNTSSAQIAVEMPNLSEKDLSALIAAVTGAFAQHNINMDKLAFVNQQSGADERTFEVRLLLFTETYRK